MTFERRRSNKLYTIRAGAALALRFERTTVRPSGF